MLQIIAARFFFASLPVFSSITQEGRNRIEDFKMEWKEILAIYRFVAKEDDSNA